jgi:hypothetical protein
MTAERSRREQREKRRHVWVSNKAFTAITGVRKVCMDCGQPDTSAAPECPGTREKKP